MIRCLKCRWCKITDGTSNDLSDLHEIKNHCSDCGRPRQFRCPKCGLTCKMLRVKNS